MSIYELCKSHSATEIKHNKDKNSKCVNAG